MNGSLTRQVLEQILIGESPDAMAVLSPEGVVWLWNPAAQSTFGYTESEAQGQALTDLVVPTDRVDEELALRRQALQGDVRLRAAMRRHKDGRLLYVDIATRAVRNAEGALQCFIVIKKDVTTLKVQRDAELVEQRYRNLLESVPDAIVIVNEGGRIVLFNGQAEHMFGWPRAEVLGSSIETLLPARYRDAHIGNRMRYHRSPQLRNMGAGLELNGLRRDGLEFPVEISLSPLMGEEGPLVMSAIRDISERRRAEVELQNINAELRVANEAKDRFLATMSHELRTPLNAILGFTGILLMRLPGELTPEQERQLNIVKGSADHLLSLINDLLDLAKIQAGMLQLLPETVDVAALLRDVHAALTPLAQAKSLVFEVDLPDQPVPLETDHRALRQIVLNLANNALKFTDRGSVRLSVRRNGAGTEIAVRDTGVGINAEDQARLFSAFTQVGDVRRRPEGTGMGLHLSARLAQMLGGRIQLQSTPGRGSCFTLVVGDG